MLRNVPLSIDMHNSVNHFQNELITNIVLNLKNFSGLNSSSTGHAAVPSHPKNTCLALHEE